MDGREDAECDFQAAFAEARRWVEAVTRQSFETEDFRAALENGVLLCDLINKIKPGIVKKINRLPTPIAGLKRQGKTKIKLEGHYGCFCDAEVISQTEEGASLKIQVEIIKGQERTERGEEVTLFQRLLFSFQNYGMKTEDDGQV